MRNLQITKRIMNNESASLDKYLQEIGRERLITAEDEAVLAKRIREEGDEQAVEKLVKANLRFVVSVAKQYQNQGLSLPDLINEGNLGIIKAAKRFDETRGFKFISYAVWWIRQSILQALGEQARIVRLPQNQVGALKKMDKTFSRLEQKFEREPTLEEIAEELCIPEDRVADTERVSKKSISMDAPIRSGDDDPGDMYDITKNETTPSPDNGLLTDALKEEIKRALSTLSVREAEVTNLYFGLDGFLAMTLEEIAEKLDLHRERVRQIREKALRRLRNGRRSRLLRAYLG